MISFQFLNLFFLFIYKKKLKKFLGHAHNYCLTSALKLSKKESFPFGKKMLV